MYFLTPCPGSGGALLPDPRNSSEVGEGVRAEIAIARVDRWQGGRVVCPFFHTQKKPAHILPLNGNRKRHQRYA